MEKVHSRSSPWHVKLKISFKLPSEYSEVRCALTWHITWHLPRNLLITLRKTRGGSTGRLGFLLHRHLSCSSVSHRSPSREVHDNACSLVLKWGYPGWYVCLLQPHRQHYSLDQHRVFTFTSCFFLDFCGRIGRSEFHDRGRQQPLEKESLSTSSSWRSSCKEWLSPTLAWLA